MPTEWGGVGVNTLRKMAITNALQNGAPIENVQQLARHSGIRTTQLYYKPSSKAREMQRGMFRFA